MEFLSPLIPYILAVIAAAVGYFSIRRKGVLAERKRQEEAQAEVSRKIAVRVAEAQSKDVEIDRKVEEKIEVIKAPVERGRVSGDRFKF